MPWNTIIFLKAEVVAELQSLSTNVQLHLRSWYQFHLEPFQAQASLAGKSSMTRSEELQLKTEILQPFLPDFAAVHIEDAEGRAIAFSPKVVEPADI